VVPDRYTAAERADVLVIATEWPEFRSLDWARLASVMNGRDVFDARSIIDTDEAIALGFVVRSLERRARPGRRASSTGAADMLRPRPTIAPLRRIGIPTARQGSLEACERARSRLR
jgi:hypothetical protein